MLKVLWRPPNNNIIKLNFDTSFNAYTNTSTAIVLARNNKGQIMGSCTYPFEGIQDAFIAEAWTCEKSLIFTMEMGFRSIQVEGDSLSTIKKIKSNKEDKSILRRLYKALFSLGKFLRSSLTILFLKMQIKLPMYQKWMAADINPHGSVLKKPQIQSRKWQNWIEMLGFLKTRVMFQRLDDGEGSGSESPWGLRALSSSLFHTWLMNFWDCMKRLG